MSKLGKPVTQRQLRVGEMIKQALGMIFIRNEAKVPNLETKGITVTYAPLNFAGADLREGSSYI